MSTCDASASSAHDDEFDYGKEFFTDKQIKKEEVKDEVNINEKSPEEIDTTERQVEQTDRTVDDSKKGVDESEKINQQQKDDLQQQGEDAQQQQKNLHHENPQEQQKQIDNDSQEQPQQKRENSHEKYYEQQEDRTEGEIDDWDELEINPEYGPTATTNTTEPISFVDALQHFENIDLKEYQDQIKPKVKHTGFSSIVHSIVGPAKLNKSLITERNLIFTLALIPFSNENEVHHKILQTIYKTLTRRKLDCARFGPQWEIIGFQGNDPSTDLRGCGMLGLLTALHFVTSLESQSLAASIYHLSRDEVQNFPFCVMSINVTRMTLQVLRHGKLNKECNHRMKHKSQKYQNEFDTTVYDVFQELFNSIFWKIYSVWKNEGKTMTESGFVVRDIETQAKHKPLQLMKEFTIWKASQKHSGHSSKKKKRKASSDDGKIESFVGIEDL